MERANARGRGEQRFAREEPRGIGGRAHALGRLRPHPVAREGSTSGSRRGSIAPAPGRRPSRSRSSTRRATRSRGRPARAGSSCLSPSGPRRAASTRSPSRRAPRRATHGWRPVARAGHRHGEHGRRRLSERRRPRAPLLVGPTEEGRPGPLRRPRAPTSGASSRAFAPIPELNSSARRSRPVALARRHGDLLLVRPERDAENLPRHPHRLDPLTSRHSSKRATLIEP